MARPRSLHLLPPRTGQVERIYSSPATAAAASFFPPSTVQAGAGQMQGWSTAIMSPIWFQQTGIFSLLLITAVFIFRRIIVRDGTSPMPDWEGFYSTPLYNMEIKFLLGRIVNVDG